MRWMRVPNSVLPEGIGYCDWKEWGEKSPLVHSEEKSIGWMKHLLNESSNLDELVVHLLSGTFAIAKLVLGTLTARMFSQP